MSYGCFRLFDRRPGFPLPYVPSLIRAVSVMALSYAESLQVLSAVARGISNSATIEGETIALQDAVGRTVAQDYFAEVSMPLFDTAAMDGFAICSSYTAGATPQNPVKFKIKATCGAGDPSMNIALRVEDGLAPCVEIMTGAPFPLERPGSISLDACVKIEDTHRLHVGEVGYIEIDRPVSLRANRRAAGGDIPQGARILSKGQIVRSSHIMPLASLGISHIRAKRHLKVGVWSTGNEICQSPLASSSVSDINGPYLVAALRERGVEARFLGAVADSKPEVDSFVGQLKETVDAEDTDVLITTGGVSVGRFDFVHGALGQADACVHFHGLPIRPGHPVLFASLVSCTGRQTSFFGLPGNPGATAATFKFIVLPFLYELQGHSKEQATWASLEEDESRKGIDKASGIKQPAHKKIDCFRHGRVSSEANGRTVKLSSEQSPSKVLPFARANCWVHIPQDFDSAEDNQVACFELFPGSIPR